MRDSLLYGLVLLSALSHAGWNALLKGSADRLVTFTAIRLVGLSFGVVVLPFVELPSAASIPWLLAATLGLYAYYVFLIRGYDEGDLSFVYPLARGVAPLLLTLMAAVVISETLSRRQGLAVGLVSAGIAVLVLAGGGNLKGALLAVVTGTSIALYSLFSGIGVRASASLLGFNALLEISCGTGLVGFAFAKRGLPLAHALRAAWPGSFVAGLLSSAGYTAFLLAVMYLPLGPVAAVRECSALFGVLIGAVVLKEGFGLRRAFAALLMTAGVAILAL